MLYSLVAARVMYWSITLWWIRGQLLLYARCGGWPTLRWMRGRFVRRTKFSMLSLPWWSQFGGFGTRELGLQRSAGNCVFIHALSSHGRGGSTDFERTSIILLSSLGYMSIRWSKSNMFCMARNRTIPYKWPGLESQTQSPTMTIARFCEHCRFGSNQIAATNRTNFWMQSYQWSDPQYLYTMMSLS